MTLPATIRTAVSQEAITKVTRLFNGTLSDVLNELLQNARRADARAIHIDTLDLAGRRLLRIRDDGHGIANPAVLVTLGQSGWEDTTQHREDPAGMGMFSLAGHRIEVRSRAGASGDGWRVVIPANAWETSAMLPIEPFDAASGTEILIDLPIPWERDLAQRVATCAQFYPLPVFLNGQEASRRNFLAAANRAVDFDGCTLGIFHGPDAVDAHELNVNFHGVAIHVDLPQVTEIEGAGTWRVKVDIIDAPQLQLVLPARKEIIQNAALAALRDRCLHEIYIAIPDNGSHRLAFKDWQIAQQLGIALPEASPSLYRWTPISADSLCRFLDEKVRDGERIVIPTFSPDIEQCAAPVLGKPEVLGARAVHEQRALEGYRWYDRLPKVDRLEFAIEIEGESHIYTPNSPGSQFAPDEITQCRVDSLTLRLTIASNPVDAADADLRVYPLRMLVCSQDGGCLDEAHILVASAASVEPNELAALLEEALFFHDDDYDSDSVETQRQRFEDEARDLACRLLLGEEEALRQRVREALFDHVSWLIPKGSTATASIRDGIIDLTLAPIAA